MSSSNSSIRASPGSDEKPTYPPFVRKETTQQMNESLDLHQGPTSTIKVADGGGIAVWTLPSRLLIQYSKFFQEGPSEYDDEGNPGAFDLSEFDTLFFDVFVQWLYFQALPSDFEDKYFDNDTDADPMHLLFPAWVLGDRISAPKFQDCMMEGIYFQFAGPCFSKALDAISVQYVMNETEKPESKLRQFVIDTLTESWGRTDFSDSDIKLYEQLFDEYPELRNAVLFKDHDRRHNGHEDLDFYLVDRQGRKNKKKKVIK